MKRNTLRLIVVLAALCIVGIAVTQIYWVRRAFDLKEDALNRELNSSLFNVAHQIFKINNMPPPDHNPVKQLSTNYFAVMVNGEVDAKLLEFLLKSEFEKRNIKLDFEYGIYNCDSEHMVYGNYIKIENASTEQKGNLPTWKGTPYYFGVQFPTREAHLLNQMGIWSFSTLVLLLVIVFFSYTLVIIFKQKRLSEIQKDFINNMTHEFKTPISTIAISAEVIKDPQTLQQPERLLNYATIIQNENNRLRLQVDRVLQAARFDKDEIGLKKDLINCEAIIAEAIQNFNLALKEKRGIIKFSRNAANPMVKGDRLHLINLFNNLIDNAIKYSHNIPEIEISICNGTIRTKQSWFGTTSIRSSIDIVVSDNGIGISEENQKRVFQKFYRVPTGNVHNVKGFGIGLYYVKLITEAHGGQLSLKSDKQGSQFIISLPSA